MSARLLGWIWAQPIKAPAKLVLMALNEYTRFDDHGDWRVFPSQKTLSEMTGMTEFTIRSHMRELERIGILKTAHQFDGNGRQMQNIYWLMAPNPSDLGGKNLSGGGERIFRGEGKESFDNPLNKESLNKEYIRPTKLDKTEEDPQWSEFWRLYPRRESKKKSLAAFAKLKKAERDAAIADLRSGRFSTTERQYIPIPTTYLNGRRWEDELAETQEAWFK